MKKRLTALAVAMAMMLSLAACGGGNSSGSDSGASASGGDSAATGSDASTGSDTSGSDAAADTGEFNPDTIEDSMTIEELRAANGEEVKVPAGLKFGIVMKSLSNEFWRTLQEGYEKAAENVKAAGSDFEIEIQATTDEGDETGQQTMTEALTMQGVNALLMSPISDSNLTSAVENANDAGVNTFCVNDGLIAEAKYYIGPNAFQNGLLAAEWISKQLGDKGQVGIVIGMAKAFAARQRTAGFKSWIEENNSGLEIVAEQNADWDRQKAKELATTWIQQHPDLKAIFCNNDGMALGVVEAVKEAEADILVVGVDGIGEAYDSIRSGGLDATIDSFPLYMSQVATEVAIRQAAGQNIPRVVATPQALIDSTNVDTPAAEIIKWVDTKYTT